MLLKNLMEEKHLNLNRPLLSVRRSSPPKNSENQNHSETDEQPLPRVPRLRPHKTELKSGPVTNPGTVPFLWEQLPGLPKEEIISQNDNSIDTLIMAPKLPPGKNSLFHQPMEKESFRSGDSDEAYLDALDTFSSSESVFLNCSTSGLTSSDEVEVNPSRNLLTGSSSRDFMMDRFLPAAKAMTSDAPQIAHKPLKKIVNGDEPSMQNGPSLMKHYLQIPDNGDEEEDKDKEESDDDNDDDQGGKLPAVCGLLPRFCSKRSFCVIHPITAMSMRTRVPKSSVTKSQGRSSVAGSFSEKEDEIRSNFLSQNLVGDFDSNSRPDGRLRGQGASNSFDESLDKEKGLVDFNKEAKNQGINGIGSDSKRGYKTFGDFLSEKDSSEESSHSTIPIVEKTLHVDVVHKVETEHEVVSTKTMNQSSSVNCSVKDTDNVESLIIGSNQKALIGEAKVYEQDQENNEVASITANQESLHKRRLQFPIPPPSPISPSESWLKRTLPSMPTRNSYLRPHLRGAANRQKEVSNGQCRDLKWETLVKTTKA